MLQFLGTVQLHLLGPTWEQRESLISDFIQGFENPYEGAVRMAMYPNYKATIVAQGMYIQYRSQGRPYDHCFLLYLIRQSP